MHLPAITPQRILVPVDFSDCAEKAYHLAVKLADTFQAELHCIHVIHLPVADEHMPPAMITQLVEDQEAASDKRLKVFTGKNDSKTIVPICKTLLGFVSDAVVQYAKTHDISLIIMGTQGMNSVGDKIFGTVSWNTIKHAHVPVLTIPCDVEVTDFRNILIPFEGTDIDMDAIAYLLNFASYFNAKLHGIHFIINNAVLNKPLADKMQMKFRKDIDAGNLLFHFISEKNITDGILKYAQHNDIDLVSMITYNKGLVATIFHMSICRYASTHFNFPLLAFNADT